MNDDLDMMKLLIDLRGGVPLHCDFCGHAYSDGRYAIPEEAGAWACNKCVDRWDAQDKAQRAALESKP